MRHLAWAVASVLLVGVVSGCVSTGGGRDVPNAELMVDEGSWYVRHKWPHDGQPIESTNFVVYSDAASVEARREVAAVAEEVWAELLDELAIKPGLLQYPAGQSKIDIYAYHDYNPQDWGGKGYYGGLLVWSPDHDQRQAGSNRLSPVMKHELVHVIQWSIAAGASRPVDTWFIEGLPLALAGDTAAIRGRDQLDRLTAKYGAGSPIAIKSYSQITNPEVGEHFHYPMFRLAVEYLLDDEGNGSSPADLRDLMIDVAQGTSFEASFEHHTGLRLDDFDNEFFGLMDAYLPRYRDPLFAPAGFALVSALVIALVISALVVGHRRSSLTAAPQGIEKAETGLVARIGFYSEISLSSLVVIAFFLGVLFAVGTEDAFNNPAYQLYQLLAYAILISYLVASIVLLLWTLRQWSRQSRVAFLVAPLVVAVTGATMLVLIIGAAQI